jgi:hypothetical protein
MNKVSTNELINLLKLNRGKVFEVSISNGFLKATHLIYWGGKILYDTGIDSIEIKWKADEFLENYILSYWEIEQVV